MFLGLSGERASYIIDSVVKGPGGVHFSGASIRYFLGRYDDLARLDSNEQGVRDKERDKTGDWVVRRPDAPPRGQVGRGG